MSILRPPRRIDMSVNGVGRPISPFRRSIHNFIHDCVWRLLPIYRRYCKFFGIEYPDYHKDDGIIISSITALPFNTVMKEGFAERIREEEVMALRLAHALGLPVPKVISYATDGTFASIWMTRLPGRPLSDVWDTELSPTEQRIIAEDIDACLARLREFPNPAGDSVTSSLSGGVIKSYGAPFGVIKPAPDEDTLIEQLVYPNFSEPYTPGSRPIAESYYIPARDLVAAGPHRCILTHGDMYRWNLLVHEGRLSGIVDWECAGWMPEWWDVANISLWEGVRPGSMWHKNIMATPSAIRYQREMEANKHLFNLMQPWKNH